MLGGRTECRHSGRDRRTTSGEAIGIGKGRSVPDAADRLGADLGRSCDLAPREFAAHSLPFVPAVHIETYDYLYEPSLSTGVVEPFADGSISMPWPRASMRWLLSRPPVAGTRCSLEHRRQRATNVGQLAARGATRSDDAGSPAGVGGSIHHAGPDPTPVP
jgi:hypothetical protein